MAIIYLNSESSSARYGLVRDIVFVPLNDLSQGAFNLQLVMKDATIDYTEVTYANDIGGLTGTGVYKITGDIHIYQNKNVYAALLEQHNGATYQMHILLTNGDVISTHSNPGTGKSTALADHPNLLRYPLLGNFRSFYGVTFQIKDIPAQGRDIHVLITGSTAEKTDWQVLKEEDFYKKFTFPPIPNSPNI